MATPKRMSINYKYLIDKMGPWKTLLFSQSGPIPTMIVREKLRKELGCDNPRARQDFDLVLKEASTGVLFKDCDEIRANTALHVYRTPRQKTVDKHVTTTEEKDTVDVSKMKVLHGFPMHMLVSVPMNTPGAWLSPYFSQDGKFVMKPAEYQWYLQEKERKTRMAAKKAEAGKKEVLHRYVPY